MLPEPIPEKPMITLHAQSGQAADARLKAHAEYLAQRLAVLYQVTGGHVPPGHPALVELVRSLAQHGKALWLFACRERGQAGRWLRHWLANVATAPVEDWRDLRERIKPLIRQVGCVPRGRRQPLLTAPACWHDGTALTHDGAAGKADPSPR